MIALVITMLIVFFGIYMIFRNQMVYLERQKFVEYFYHQDPNGHDAGHNFREHIASYDEMLFKFWVWPLSSFYPDYRAYKRGVK